MFRKIFLFILGCLLSSFGLMYIIIYLNLLSMGYTFYKYLLFIIKRYECILFLVGIILICISLRKKKEKHEIRI